MIFHESICAKLGGTMRIFRNQWKTFQNINLSIMTKNLYQKDIQMSTFGVETQFVFQLVSRHNWFSKGSLIEGEQDFTKSCHGSLKWFHFAKLMIQVWLCAPK